MQLIISLTVYSTAESAQCLAMLTCASADLHVIPSSSSLPNVSNSTQGRDDPDDLLKYSFMNKILVIPLSYCIKIPWTQIYRVIKLSILSQKSIKQC